MKKAVITVLSLFLLILSASCRVVVKTDAENHPAYLHALSDLRMARAYLDKLTPDEQLNSFETAAIGEINGAIKEIKDAAIDDGKNPAEHEAIDAKLTKTDRYTKALELLYKVYADINREDDNAFANELKKKAVQHVEKAQFLIKQINIEPAPAASAPQTQSITAPQSVPANQDGQFSLGISNGLLFRFVSKDWSGFEIPLAAGYTSSNSGDILNSSVSTGFGIVMPVKIIGGLHVNFIPEITAGYARTLSVTNDVEYNSATKLEELDNLTSSGYTITAGAACKLEVEYFLSNLISFLPGNISIGGNVTLSFSGNYASNSNQAFDAHLNEVTTTRTNYFGTAGALALNGTTLSNLVIRYYF